MHFEPSSYVLWTFKLYTLDIQVMRFELSSHLLWIVKQYAFSSSASV